jgi:hypothetical protein
MIYITITDAAYEALVAWKPEAIRHVEPAPGGGFNLSLFRPHLQQLNAFQRSGESYSELIIRAAQESRRERPGGMKIVSDR